MKKKPKIMVPLPEITEVPDDDEAQAVTAPADRPLAEQEAYDEEAIMALILSGAI